MRIKHEHQQPPILFEENSNNNNQNEPKENYKNKKEMHVLYCTGDRLQLCGTLSRCDIGEITDAGKMEKQQ